MQRSVSWSCVRNGGRRTLLKSGCRAPGVSGLAQWIASSVTLVGSVASRRPRSDAAGGGEGEPQAAQELMGHRGAGTLPVA